MALILKAPERLNYSADVTPAGTGAEPLHVELQGRYRTRTQLREHLEGLGKRPDDEILADELLGWDVEAEPGTPAPCDLEHIRRLLDIYPHAATAFHDAYVNVLTEAGRKN